MRLRRHGHGQSSQLNTIRTLFYTLYSTCVCLELIYNVFLIEMSNAYFHFFLCFYFISVNIKKSTSKFIFDDNDDDSETKRRKTAFEQEQESLRLAKQLQEEFVRINKYTLTKKESF